MPTIHRGNCLRIMHKMSIILISLALASCAHESQIAPSTAHIDEQTDIRQNQVSAVSGIPKPIKNNTFLPPPKAKAKEQTYSVVVNEVPVKEILFALARDSKLNIDIHPSIQGRVTLNAVDQTLPAILERLAKQVDLTYKIEGNVLSITPDLPVLRSYKIDYVNISRDTTGFIGAAAEISSTGQSATTGAGGTSTTSSASGNGANNSSRTSVTSESKNRFWTTLVQNVKDILAETDKEVIISRTSSAKGGKGESNSTNPSAKTANQTNESDDSNNVQSKAEREDARAEYKTLFAATVIANPEAGVISVRATNKQHQAVQEFLDKVMASARRQVLIEATIVEVQLSDTYQAGIDWSRLNNLSTNSGFQFQQSLGPQATFNSGGRLTGFGQNALSLTPAAGFVAGYINSVSRFGNIAASITLLSQFGNTKVLSSPKLMVLNNQTAVLKVVNNLVYFTVQAQQSQAAVGGSTLSTITTVPNTVPVGVVMSVTPQVNDAGDVNINVRPTISRVVGSIQDPNPSLVNVQSFIPQIQVREMESILQISSGSTAVLGGLMQDEIFRNADSVPGLNKLPLLGKIFTAHNDANRKTELVIFLRPTVITRASLESDELQSFKQFLPSQQLQQTLDESVN